MLHSHNPTIDRLLARKTALETRIADELARPLPDSVRLQALKRERLFLKDRAAALMNARPVALLPIPARIA